MSSIRIFRVGGSVRDELLGLRPKDHDFAVEASSFDTMREWMLDKDFNIFVESPAYFTIRARFPQSSQHRGLCADFTLCRIDGPSSDSRRPDSVTMGTIFDDLSRRDFTINAMALDEDGVLIDPHGGQKDLEARILRFVGDPELRIAEDGLRVLRAIRFQITKALILDITTSLALGSETSHKFLENVSTERIREELVKAFRVDTVRTIRELESHGLLDVVLGRTGLWLEPTLKEVK